jgi:hypothetical protein
MPAALTAEELERQTTGRLDALRHELGDSVAPERVAVVGRRHFERLTRHATVTDFIPLLVYRFTREELLYREAVPLEDAA